ncbi:hypothetical protein D3C80_2061390 [compost metagenome]
MPCSQEVSILMPASSSTSKTLRSAGIWKTWPLLASSTSKETSAPCSTGAAAKNSRCTWLWGHPAFSADSRM